MWQADVPGHERKNQSLGDDSDQVHVGLPNTFDRRGKQWGRQQRRSYLHKSSDGV
jgi:hypothetical protein